MKNTLRSIGGYFFTFQGILSLGDIMIFIIFSAVISYFIGCINPALLISKKFYNKDIRSEGSGNPGATNITRIFGKKAGLTVFIIDFAKGLVAVLIARILVRFLNAPYESVLFAGFFVQIGHIFPVFYKFRGGKGVSAAAGAAMGIMPLTAVVVLLVFVIVLTITKTVSVSSLLSAVSYPLVAYVMGGNNSNLLFLFAASCSILIIVKHSQNIRRLLDGKEKPVK